MGHVPNHQPAYVYTHKERPSALHFPFAILKLLECARAQNSAASMPNIAHYSSGSTEPSTTDAATVEVMISHGARHQHRYNLSHSADCPI